MSKLIVTKVLYIDDFDTLGEIIESLKLKGVDPKNVRIIWVDYEGPWFEYEALETDKEYESRLAREKFGEEDILTNFF